MILNVMLSIKWILCQFLDDKSLVLLRMCSQETYSHFVPRYGLELTQLHNPRTLELKLESINRDTATHNRGNDIPIHMGP